MQFDGSYPKYWPPQLQLPPDSFISTATPLEWKVNNKWQGERGQPLELTLHLLLKGAPEIVYAAEKQRLQQAGFSISSMGEFNTAVDGFGGFWKDAQEIRSTPYRHGLLPEFGFRHEVFIDKTMLEYSRVQLKLYYFELPQGFHQSGGG